jgi:hypothetical protein
VSEQCIANGRCRVRIGNARERGAARS